MKTKKIKNAVSATILFADTIPEIKTRAEFRAAKNLLGEILQVHYAPKNGEYEYERCDRYYYNDFWQLAHMAITMIDILDELEAFDGREVEAGFDRFEYSKEAILYFRGYAWNYQSTDVYFYCTTTHDLCYCRFNAAAAARVALDALKIEEYNLQSLKSVSVFGDKGEPNYPSYYRATNRKVALMACAEYQAELNIRSEEMRRQEKENAQQLNLQAANNAEDDGSNDDADNDTEELVDTAENKQQTTLQAAANNAPDTTTLAQRVIKIQFHLQNIANSAIIIGQELIECKKEVGHGNWQNWLKDNFSMTYRTAKNFMDIADRFGSLSNSQEVKSISLLNSTQLIALLALPAGEEENFIAEKAAEGNPVEKMTIKQEREEIKKYKAKIEKLEKDNKQLTDVAHTLRLENEALKDQEPQVIETVKTITPPDYVATIQRAEELQQQVDQLLEQNEDAQKTIADLQDQVLDAVSKQGEIQIEYVEKETVDAEIKRRKEQHVFEELKQFYDIAHFLFHNLDTVKNLKSRFRDGGLSHFDTGNTQIDQVLKVLITNVEAVTNEIYGNKNK